MTQELLTTQQVGQRIRRGTLVPYADHGEVFCVNGHDTGTQTEALRFWRKGDQIGCDVCGKTTAEPRFTMPNGDTITLNLLRQ